jgi:hypothetical protein
MPWLAGDGREVEGSDGISYAALVYDRPEHPPGIDLLSVILLI